MPIKETAFLRTDIKVQTQNPCSRYMPNEFLPIKHKMFPDLDIILPLVVSSKIARYKITNVPTAVSQEDNTRLIDQLI